MTKQQAIQLFQEHRVRTVWDYKEEKWYFSIVDVAAVLTYSADPKQYIKRMKSRDEMLKSNWGTICILLAMRSEDGKAQRGKGCPQQVRSKIRAWSGNNGKGKLLSACPDKWQ